MAETAAIPGAELRNPPVKPLRSVGDGRLKIGAMRDPVLDVIDVRKRYGKTVALDGVSVEYPDWHFNVRPSNTEPLLRLNLEGTTPEQMEAKRDEVLAIIRS